MSLRDQCIQQAKEMGDELFLWDCETIIRDTYKGRAGNMKLETLINLLNDMMGVGEFYVEKADLTTSAYCI